MAMAQPRGATTPLGLGDREGCMVRSNTEICHLGQEEPPTERDPVDGRDDRFIE